jgi:hypothetical protein
MKKKKPSDYRSGFRYLKKENVGPDGNVFKMTDFKVIDKSQVAGEHDWRIRLTLDSAFWFELYGQNLDTVIKLAGDDFDHWYGKKLGFVVAEFTAQDGNEKQWIKIVPAPSIELKAPHVKKLKPLEPRQPEPQEDEEPLPF